MTKRSVVIGLLLAAGIAGFYYINNYVVMQDDLIGDYMPISVYGIMILMLVCLNPLLSKIRPSLALTGSEYAVILSIALVSCAVPGSGLMRFFPNSMMLPHNTVKTKIPWQSESIMEMVPGHMLAGTPPALLDDDFLTPTSTCKALADNAAAGSLSEPQKRIWEMLAPEKQDAIKALAPKIPAPAAVSSDTSDATIEKKAPNEATDDTAKAVKKEVKAEKKTGAAVVPKAKQDRPQEQAAPRSAIDLEAAKTLAGAFNTLLDKRDLYVVESFPKLTLDGEVKRIFNYLGEKDHKPVLASADAVTEMLSRPKARAEQIRIFNRHLIDVAWKKDIKSRAARRNEEVGTYLMGMKNSKGPATLSQVPWSAWKRPLTFWMPIFIVISVGILCLSLIVHTQWSKHEMLPYPLVRFTTAMLPGEDGKNASVFSQTGFWWAFGTVVVVFMLNFAYKIWPEHLFGIPMVFDFSAFGEVIPGMDTGLAKWMIWSVRVSPLVIGVAFLVRSDVAVSVGLSVPLSVVLNAVLAYYGVSLAVKTGGGRLYNPRPQMLFIAGAYVAFMGQILYTGRAYYMSVAKRAIGLKADGNDVSGAAAWSARVFVVTTIILWVVMISNGIDWMLSAGYIALAFMMFLVMSRIIAETGIFFYMTGWYPCCALLGLMGMNAIGPGTAILMFMFTNVLLVRPREALMPFAVGGFKLLSDKNVKYGRMIPWFVVALILAIAISVPVALRYTHGMGMSGNDGWGRVVSVYPFEKAVHMQKFLRAQGRLEDVESLRGLSRLSHIKPETKTVVMFILGAVFVALLSFARIRWRWWPFHPVMVILLYTGTCVELWHSFLIGWLIRTVVVKYGGQSAYHKVLPIMMGLMAGGIMGTLLPNIIGVVYYFITGDRLASTT